jgi:glycosyltransferase involved in cell wall biosynthesis
MFIEQQYVGAPMWGDGVGPFTVEITRQLAERGHEVHVLSCVYGQATRDVMVDGVSVHYRGEVRLRGAWRLVSIPGANRARDVLTRDAELFRWLRLSVSTYVEFKRLGIDVDVIESSTYPRSTLLFALFQPRPLVLTAHLPGWRQIIEYLGHEAYIDQNDAVSETPLRIFQTLSDAATAYQARRAAALTVPSRLVAEAYKYTPVYSNMTSEFHVVPFSISPDPWRSVADVQSNGTVVLQVGSLEPRKAPETLVDAGAQLVSRFPDLEVVFVGRSLGIRDNLPYVDWLRKRASDSGSPCRFVGPVKREELPNWYGRARAVVLSSWFDTFPVAGLEALASGRPLVCTTEVGYADLVQEVGAGAVIPAGDARALADALIPYLEHNAIAGLVGSAGRHLVTDGKLSIDATLGCRLAVYESAYRGSARVDAGAKPSAGIPGPPD